MSSDQNPQDEDIGSDIAIVGLGIRVPGALTAAEYWKNLREGVESVRTYSESELLALGESKEKLALPNYVKAAAPLDNMELFDGEFFGFSPKESAILDPQHRQFLETVWEAFEDAGHVPSSIEGPVGVWAGCGMGSYFYFNLCSRPELVRDVGMFLLRHTGNDKDFLATRASYLLNLKGPSVGVQTACSSSLVAIHLAAQSLLSREVDFAVAGGVTIELPHRRGYLFQDGEILSPSGHCHAFDHRAQGTVFGSGAGSVILRRLSDALEDRDHIYAVIRGSAVNNDGGGKVNYLAPSVDGQAACMVEAYQLSGISADDIQYIECHGTGTYLGDPIEVAALTQAFRTQTKRKNFCRIGSVKTNIGHLDTAAGVASLAKVALALKHGELPPSLNYEKPNDSIAFDVSPFQVQTKLEPWPTPKNKTRLAAVNSLGVGGTNAHVVLTESPKRAPSAAPETQALTFQISARSQRSLDAYAVKLAKFLEETDARLVDVAHTLAVGRKTFDHRRVFVAQTKQEAILRLRDKHPSLVYTHQVTQAASDVVFLLPGGGAQYPQMAAGLYRTSPVAKSIFDRGFEILLTRWDIDLRAALFGEDSQQEAQDATLSRMSFQLPAIFLCEVVSAKLWEQAGVKPKMLLGHSLGENTAAHLAGVLSFDDALTLVTERGRLFETLPDGAMLNIELSPSEASAAITDLALEAELDVAVINGQRMTAISGSTEAIQKLALYCESRSIETKRLPIPVAAHSRAIDSILPKFKKVLASLTFHAPQIPILSNRDGKVLSDKDATSADYWAVHLRNTVHFTECLKRVSESPSVVAIEVGPGRALTSLLRAYVSDTGQKSQIQTLTSLRHRSEQIDDELFFETQVARLWAVGLADIQKPTGGDRISIPTYAFDHQHFFIEPSTRINNDHESRPLSRTENLNEWFFEERWRAQEPTASSSQGEPRTLLIFADEMGVALELSDQLQRGSSAHLWTNVVVAQPGDEFVKLHKHLYQITPEQGLAAYSELIRAMQQDGLVPTHVAHLWLLTAKPSWRRGSSFFHRNQEHGFYSLLFLSQALLEEGRTEPLSIVCAANGALPVEHPFLASTSGSTLWPEKALALGPIKVLPKESPNIRARFVDVDLTTDETAQRRKSNSGAIDIERLVRIITLELDDDSRAPVCAWRGPIRFVQELHKKALAEADVKQRLASSSMSLSSIVITGGLGGLGLVFARHFAPQGAKIALIGRSELPPASEWSAHLKRFGQQERVSRQILQLQDLEKLGAKVLVLQADVAIEMELDLAIKKVVAEFGQIDAVLHTAGVLRDGPLLTKTFAECEEVFTPKVHGTEALYRLLEPHNLKLFAVFSSTSAAIAPAGQVDYVAANTYLNSFMQYAALHARKNGRRTRYLAIGWGIWADAGMAHEQVSAPTDHWTAWQTVQDPLINALRYAKDGSVELKAEIGPQDWLVDGHRTLSGRAIVPGTAYLAWISHGLACLGISPPHSVREMYFLNPIELEDDVPVQVTVEMLPRTNGYDVRFTTANAKDTQVRLHAQATVVETRARLEQLILSSEEQVAQLARYDQVQGFSEPSASAQAKHIRFGERWFCLNEIRTGADKERALARLSLGTFAAEVSGPVPHRLHPALLDTATGYAMSLIPGYTGDHLWAPIAYQEFNVYRPLSGTIISEVVLDSGSQEDGEAAFSGALFSDRGELLCRFRGLRLRMLSGPELKTRATTEVAHRGKTLTEPAERLVALTKLGILEREGPICFDRAVNLGQNIYISSVDLDLLTAAEHSNTSEAATFARPDLRNNYEAPATELERQLCAFFSELLGVGEVGATDSFFDLGGHSLIAVRLFAKIRKTYNVDFPMSVLFDAASPRTLGARIASASGVSDLNGSTVNNSASISGAPTEVERYRYLVPMHGGSLAPTDALPFFLVAGMFGNVLNLRHLANLVGKERPFFGLQARGLLGNEEPHHTFEEMSAAYLEELESKYPEGPVILGGFSGGGITAYEMAKTLLKKGRTVPLLVLLDTPLPHRDPLGAKDRLRIQLDEIQKQGLSYAANWAKRRLDWEQKKRAAANQPRQGLHNAQIEEAFRRALSVYQLSAYPGEVVLFRPKLDPAWQFSDGTRISHERAYMSEDNGWTPWVHKLSVYEVPGNHDSMVLEPNVRAIAKQLRKLLSEVQTDSVDSRLGTLSLGGAL